MERRLSDVICENTDIKSLQKNAFLTKGPDNPLVPCRDTNLRSRLDFLGLAKSLAVLLGAEFTPSAIPEENVSDLENRYGVWKNDSNENATGNGPTPELGTPIPSYNITVIVPAAAQEPVPPPLQKYESSINTDGPNIVGPQTEGSYVGKEIDRQPNYQQDAQQKDAPNEIAQPTILPSPINVPPQPNLNVPPVDSTSIPQPEEHPTLQNIQQPKQPILTDLISPNEPLPEEIPATSDQEPREESHTEPTPQPIPTLMVDTEVITESIGLEQTSPSLHSPMPSDSGANPLTQSAITSQENIPLDETHHPLPSSWVTGAPIPSESLPTPLPR